MSKLNNILKKFTMWIKNTKYVPQLPLYEVVLCETKYEKMAAKGWILEKRGAYLDCYKRGKPIQQQYRLEFCEVKAFDGVQKLSDDQLDYYSKCGWTKVCEHIGVYIFSAPKDNYVEELHADAQEHIRMLKSVNNRIGGFSITFACIIVLQFVAHLLFGSENLLSWAGLYEADWLMFTLLASFLYIVWKWCYGRYRIFSVVRQLKKGYTLHAHKEKPSKHIIRKILNSVLCALLGVCLICTVIMLINTRKSVLPEAGSNVPYLLGEDFLNGKRSDNNWYCSSLNNEVKVTHGLLSNYYNVHEYIELDDGLDISIYQDCFILHGDGGSAINLAKSLAKNSIFKNTDDFEEIGFDGLDYVLTGPYTVIAVKGQSVIRVTYIGEKNTIAGLDGVLRALSDKWK